MRETKGDIWEFHPAHPIVITTNGTVNSRGLAVMGRGVARQAAEKYPLIRGVLANRLVYGGNRVHLLTDEDGIIFSFPVKHKWWERADLDLIAKSASQLVIWADEAGLDIVYLPRPGCDNGRRTWEEVKPIIEPILDDRFVVVEYEKGK